MRFPVNDPYKITTKFSAAHKGIDIAPIPAGSLGVAFYAPERSKVIANSSGKVEGNYIKLQGLETGRYYYAGHFARTFVITGTIVKEGEVLATLGQTGLATGVHTHFEVRTTSSGGQIDPLTINWNGGNVSDFKQEAIDRMNMLVGIAKIVIPNFSGEVDGNNYPQIIANINQLYAQNNVVTGIAEDRLKRIKELEAGANGEFEPVPYPVFRKKVK
jgi:murein DD-endopeptidase MepM/ murein hydrolase activator NlpD